MSNDSPSGDSPSRRRIAHDLIVFQVKLWVEGFKDFVLMPLSLGAALLDLVTGKGFLYGVMRLGDRFERWVHLYGALDDEEDLSDAVRKSLDEGLSSEMEAGRRGTERESPRSGRAGEKEKR